MAAKAPRRFLYLGSNSGVPSVSGDGQFQGAAVFKALVERGFKLEPDGVGVVLLGLGLVAAHHLLAKGNKMPNHDTIIDISFQKKRNSARPCGPGRQRASSGCSQLRSSSSWPGSCKTLGSSAAASEPDHKRQPYVLSSCYGTRAAVSRATTRTWPDSETTPDLTTNIN